MRRATDCHPPDSALVASVHAGDREAFSMLVDRYSAVLSSIAFTRLRNPEDVRDAVQESFVIAYCTLDRLADPERLGAWLRGIVLNRCAKYVEKRARAERFLSRLPHRTELPDAHSLVDRQMRAGELRDALERLSEPHREIVLLFYFQGTSVEEIADLVHKPVGSIKRILSDARGKLREDLIEMARNEFTEYSLGDEQKRRLERIPAYPREEPKIVTAASDEPAKKTVAWSPQGNFAKLDVGSEAFFADYDYPGRALQMISTVVVQGPFDVAGAAAFRFDDLSFSADGKVEGIWRPYYSVDGDLVLYCAKECGATEKDLQVLTPTHASWGESVPRPESLVLVPGERRDPEGDRPGYVVSDRLWKVQIGRRRFACIRRIAGGDVAPRDWADSPLADTGVEEFFLPDGRLLLWRRYNGPAWDSRDPFRRAKAGNYAHLAKAGTPALEIFGCRYHLWYDQIPDYALSG